MSSSESTSAKWLRPGIPDLTPGGVHVWTIALTVPDRVLVSFGELLSSDERERASQFRFEGDARRFVVARGSARRLLAAYVQREPSDLKFCYSGHGKPSLAEASDNLRFNLSHSHDLALLAVAHGRELGVDLEWMCREVETEKLAERFFSVHEQETLRAVPEPERTVAFYRIWTCKEAFLKAQGSGFSRALDSFDIELAENRSARLSGTRPDGAEASRWSLRELGVAKGYAAALAVEGPITELVQLRYDDAGLQAVPGIPDQSAAG
jgi:4'-phosphopantetheinyl transferase